MRLENGSIILLNARYNKMRDKSDVNFCSVSLKIRIYIYRKTIYSLGLIQHQTQTTI